MLFLIFCWIGKELLSSQKQDHNKKRQANLCKENQAQGPVQVGQTVVESKARCSQSIESKIGWSAKDIRVSL